MKKNKILSSVHIEPSGLCNLRCKYCYNSRFVDDVSLNKISFEKWLCVIDEAYALGCRDFSISGGEFLIYPYCEEMLNYIANKNVERIAVFSNAMNINEEFCKNFSLIEPKLEFRISFDGYSKADAIRVGSSYKKIIDSLRLLRLYNYPVVINTLATTINYQDFNNMFDDFKNLDIQKWLIDIPFKQGRAESFWESLAPNFLVVEVLCNIIKRYLDELPQFVLEIQNLFKSQMLNEQCFRFDLNSGVCSYISDGVTIRSDGNVAICPTLALSCGNILEQSLEDIFLSKERESLLSIKVQDLNKCPNCKYVNICGGGCRADALAEKGSLYDFDPIACYLMGVLEEKVLPILPENMRERISSLIK
ncbi:MAG: radical SAM protein [Bdellovibrionota bacterium]